MTDPSTSGPMLRHLDHTISVNQYLKFVVSGPLFDKTDYPVAFDTVEAAKQRIESRVKSAEQKKKVKLSIRVISEKGISGTITGIHSRDGTFNGVAGQKFYPDYPVVAKLIERRREIYELLAAVDKKLDSLEVRAHGYSYGKLSAEGYLQRVAEIEDRFTQVKALAIKLQTEADNEKEPAPG